MAKERDTRHYIIIYYYVSYLILARNVRFILPITAVYTIVRFRTNIILSVYLTE